MTNSARMIVAQRIQIMDELRDRGVKVDEGLYAYFKSVLETQNQELH